jgi:hypothetical protein
MVVEARVLEEAEPGQGQRLASMGHQRRIEGCSRLVGNKAGSPETALGGGVDLFEERCHLAEMVGGGDIDGILELEPSGAISPVRRPDPKARLLFHAGYPTSLRAWPWLGPFVRKVRQREGGKKGDWLLISETWVSHGGTTGTRLRNE